MKMAAEPCQIGSHRFDIAKINDGDRMEVLRLFAEVFNFSPAPGWYDWKYRSGGGEAIGLWSEAGHLAAHYAGFPRELRWQGTAVKAIQIGDVMVAPDIRGLLTRKGPFFKVCSRFLSDLVGHEKNYRIAFGFPNDRAMRLGATLGIYHHADTIHQISWSTRQQALPLGWRWTPLANEKNPTQQINQAWQSMSMDFKDYVLGVRDADYLYHRFLNRPDRKYRIFCLRRWPLGNAAAVVIMYIEHGRAELLDVIGARPVFAAAARGAALEAARAEAETLTAWVSPASLAAFDGSGAESIGDVAHLAVEQASAMTAAEVEAARWCCMGGDTDFL